MVSSLYARAKEELKNAPEVVLNLILDGRLLIPKLFEDGKVRLVRKGFKPCFRWSAPYTLMYIKKKLQ